MSSHVTDHRDDAVDHTSDEIINMDGNTDFPEFAGVDNLTIREIIAEDADWLEDLGMGEDWKTDDSGDMASCEASEDEDDDPDYDCIKLESPSSGNDCAEVFEIGVQRPQVITRAHREQLEEEYQQYEAESSAGEDATPEDIMKPSRFVAAHGDLEQSCNIPLPASPNDGDGRDALDKEDLTANTALEDNLAQELAQSLDDSIASLTADATDEPELDETTLELIAYVEYLRDPKASKTASERHHTVRPQKFYPVHNLLTLADVETSRPLPQPQPRPGSKGHLDDRTDAADAIEDLKVLFANLSTDITRAHRQRDHNTPLQDELLDEWLDQGIATTNALLRQGKTALASKASEMVGRVLANEKGVGRGKTAGCGGGQIRGVKESRDITSERRVSSRRRFPVKVESGSRDS